LGNYPLTKDVIGEQYPIVTTRNNNLNKKGADKYQPLNKDISDLI
jgi:hypothetical protein